MKQRFTSSFIAILLSLFWVRAKGQDIEWHPLNTIGGSGAEHLTVSTDNTLYCSNYISDDLLDPNHIFRYNNSIYNWSELFSTGSLLEMQVSDSIFYIRRYDNPGSEISLSVRNGNGHVKIEKAYQFRSAHLNKDHSFVYCTSEPNYVIRTTDLGATWDTLVGPPVNNFITPQLSCAESKDKICVWGSIKADNFFTHTTDGGLSWNWITLVPSVNMNVQALTYHNDTIFAIVNNQYLYKGTDTLYRCNTQLPYFAASYPYKKLIISKDGCIFAIHSSHNAYRSCDNGNSWDSLSINGQFTDLCCDSSGNIYYGNSEGVFLSSDHGDTWTEIGTSRRIKPRHIIAGRKPYLFSDSLLALSRSLDNGHTWTKMLIPGMQELQAFHVTANGDLVAAIKDTSRDVKLITSSDNGDTWSQLPVPLGQPLYNIFFIITSNNKGDIFALDYSENLYILENGSGNWIKSTISGVVSNTFAIAAGDSGVVYSGSAFGKVYRSDNNGRLFKPLTDIEPNATVKHIVIAQNGTLYLGTDSAGVFRSSDKGKTWESVNTGLPEKSIVALGLDPSDGVYAATQKGVQYLFKNDDVWQSVNDGLFDSNIFSMTMQEGSDLFVSTSQFGIFHTSLPSRSVRTYSTNRNISLSLTKEGSPSLYEAQWSIAERGFGSIELIDALGRTIRTLSRGVFEAGENRMSFSANDLASGVYFVRLTAGNAKAVAPFIR
jgi:photosystem II stability/assembly factor-like uncharacterized protein